MSILPVSPTRMELTRLKKQLQLSVHGHKLLKDKQDELMRQFVALIRENNELRAKAEPALVQVRTKSLLAKAPLEERVIEPGVQTDENHPVVAVEIETVNMMGLTVPQMRFQKVETVLSSFLDSTPALRNAQMEMTALLPELLRLAQIEKTCVVLAAEIEKVRRRVNALEYVTIPQLRETIRFIRMRLDDAERDRITRLIKMEDMGTKAN